MNLYVLRHAKAEKEGSRYPHDEARPLSPDGVKSMKRIAPRMGKLIGCPDLILTSPLLRAQQTADLAAEGCGYPRKPEADEALAGESGIFDLIQRIRKTNAKSSLMVVGHAPSLDMLISRLISPDDKTQLKLPKGALALVEIDDPKETKGTLRWIIPPEAW